MGRFCLCSFSNCTYRAGHKGHHVRVKGARVHASLARLAQQIRGNGLLLSRQWNPAGGKGAEQRKGRGGGCQKCPEEKKRREARRDNALETDRGVALGAAQRLVELRLNQIPDGGEDLAALAQRVAVVNVVDANVLDLAAGPLERGGWWW